MPSIGRRTLAAASLALPLAAPRLAASQGSRVLRFVPQADVTVLDPLWSTAFVSRNHA